MGTRSIGPARFAALFEMITAGRLNPGRLVTRTIPLSEAGAATHGMDSFQGGGVIGINQMDC